MEQKNNEEEIALDFSKIKSFFSKGKRKMKKEEKEIDEKIGKEEDKIEGLEAKKDNAEEKEEELQEDIDDEKEKISDLKEKKQELEEEEKQIEKEEAEINKKEKDVAFDLKKIKNIFKKKEKVEAKESKNDISFDPSRAWQFILKYKMLFLILIPIFFSIWFRAYPVYLPATDDWARGTVYDGVRSSIASQVEAQYPNLPVAQKSALVQKQFDELLDQQGDAVEQQIKTSSEYFKSRMQDEDGQTYLLAIDPWSWYGYARNYLRNGHFGNTFINDTVSWYTLRNGREGKKVNFIFFSFLTVLNYKIMNIFGDFSVMAAAFYLPLVLMTLASIAAFFAGKRIGGYPAALTASIIVGVHAALLNRTAAGFADTDNVIALFEMLTVAFFMLAFGAKDKKKTIIYTALASLSIAFYSISHQSWWHIFDFVLGAFGLYFLYYVWIERKHLKKGLSSFLKLKKTKNLLTIFFGFILSSWILGAVIRVFIRKSFFESLKGVIIAPFWHPLVFIAMKKVAVKSIWPNVLTTVAELNTSSVSAVISQIGGKFLFFLSIIGILLLLVKDESRERKNLFYGLLIIFWYVGAIYAAQSSIRFTTFLVPGFALAMGAFVAFTYSGVSKWMIKEIHINALLSKSIIVIIFLIVIFLPILAAASNTAEREVPSMNDAWYESLIGIKQDSEDAIITSWWDFGHWFVSVAERRVTFDGGDQGERIHWVGKSLLTDDEATAIGILRMLNCGQEKAPHMLEKYLSNNTVKAINILNTIIVENRQKAGEILKNEGLNEKAVNEVLAVTHCADLIPQYYITSEDMVGKAGVWGHFGSWNFTKASMYNKVNKESRGNGVRILMEDFGLSEEEANDIYYEIKSTDADRWVSPWPGFMGESSCSVGGKIVTCGNGLKVNLDTYDAELTLRESRGIPYSLVYADKDGVHEKMLEGSSIGASVALIPDGDKYRSVLMDPMLANSIFTRLFYFEGHGLECFDLFSYKKSFVGNEIYVWKVDWECKTRNVMKEIEKEGETQEPENDEVIDSNITDTNLTNESA